MGRVKYITTFESALDVVRYLEANNGKLVMNIGIAAVGHMLVEFDYFARLRFLGEVAPGGTHLYMGAYEERAACLLEMYGSALCSAAVLSDTAPEMARAVALFRPDLTVDVGTSSTKYAPILGRALTDDLDTHGRIKYNSQHPDLLRDQQNSARRRIETYEYNPMRRRFDMPADLEALVKLEGRRLALIQIKAEFSSGSPEATNAETYLPALKHLRGQGYRLVFVGREKMPDVFSGLGIVDYANSPLASFKNDLILFSNASFALVGASGISQFADLMGIPYVMVNAWMISSQPLSHACVVVPALARSRETGELLTISDQVQQYNRTGTHFPLGLLEPVQPDAADTLAAVAEALDIAKRPCSLSEEQRRFRDITVSNDALGVAPYTLSRVSSAFLQRHQQILH